MNQFAIQTYSKPCRFDRIKNEGGAFIYIRENIPSKKLKIQLLQRILKVVLSKLIWLKLTWLFCGCYHSPSQSDQYFFENIGKTLDKYSKHYDKFMLVGHFNVEESEPCLTIPL